MDWKRWLKPKPSELTEREFSEEMYLLQHHVAEANKAYKEGNEELAQEHLDHARTAQDRICCVALRITGNITKSVEEWSKGTDGLIGSSHPYTRYYEVELYRSLREVWFTVQKPGLGLGYRVVGHTEYNGGEATFDPRKVEIIFVGQQDDDC